MTTPAAAELQAGFAHELAYWDRELSLRGAYPDAILRRTIPARMREEFPHYLLPYFEELKIAAAPRLPKVLDVGSGPLSMLAFGPLTNLFELTGVDPLASQYLPLLAKHGHAPNCSLVEGPGERLAEIFPPATFDLVWMHNALDHSQSPPDVVRAMTTVVRPGGYLVIQGWAREGAAEGWTGLHQHDLFLDNERLMWQPRGGHSACLTDGLPLAICEAFQGGSGRDWVRLICRRESASSAA